MAKKEMKRGRKLNGDILSIRDFPDGVRGKIGELECLTRKNGEVVQGAFGQDLHSLELIDLDTGKVQKYWADGGLRGALTLSKVTPGTPVEIVHTGEKSMMLENGNQGRVQSYDIYLLED